MNAISSVEPSAIDFAALMAAPVTEMLSPAATVAAPPNPYRFNDALEAAFTGIVLTGVLLVAAGMLRDAVPVCTARDVANDLLVIAALVSAALSVFFVGRNIFGR